jgi:hypothetical protein
VFALLSTLACTRTPPGSEAPEPASEYVHAYLGKQVLVRAAPHLRGEVERVFAVLEAMAAESFEIEDGGLLPIGWTTLRFSVHGDRISLQEPDYDGDPETQWRADISVSLATLARQRAVLDRIDIPGEAINFDQHVLLVRGVLDDDKLFMMRVPSPGGRTTGWRVIPSAGMAEDDEVDSVPVYAIMRERPILIDAMLLPAGFMVVVEGDRITQLIDPQDEVVWDSTRDQAGIGDHEQPSTEAGDPQLLKPLGESE